MHIKIFFCVCIKFYYSQLARKFFDLYLEIRYLKKKLLSYHITRKSFLTRNLPKKKNLEFREIFLSLRPVYGIYDRIISIFFFFFSFLNHSLSLYRMVVAELRRILRINFKKIGL